MKQLLLLSVFVSGCTVTVVEQQAQYIPPPVFSQVEICYWVDDVRYDYYGRLTYHNKYYVCDPA